MPSPPDNNGASVSSSDNNFLRTHALPLSLVALSTLFALLGDSATRWLRYDRDAILHGQWWRLISGNIVHLGWPHLLLNLAGLASAAAVGVGLLLFDPHLQWYVGLSGVLHGLFAAGLVTALYTGNRGDWWLLLLFVAKITWEQLVGTMPGSAEIAGGTVIVNAHLYGAIGGALMAWLIIMEWKRKHRHT